ncbi:spore wall synthesis complex protein [Yimella radicis]
MPLSEHEQRMLEQMERALSEEDPKFASQMRAVTSPRRGRLMIAAFGMMMGLAVAVVGVMNNFIWLGVVGFVVMVAVAAWAFNGSGSAANLGTVQDDGTVRPAEPRGHRPRGGRGRGVSRPGKQRSSGSFMQRLEARWEKRRREQW